MEFLNEQQLESKWGDVLDESSSGAIKDSHRRRVTAVVMENTERALQSQRESLNETVPGSSTANVANYDPVLIGLIRRAMPKLIAFDLIGVQPMTMPTGLVFALRSRYTNSTGAEALFNEADALFSAGDTTNTGTDQVGVAPVDATNSLNPWTATSNFTNGAGTPSTAPGMGVGTAAGEDFGYGTSLNAMTFTIEKQTVTAKERALQAGYTVELAQDLKAVHGLDAESELSNLLSNEVITEINREIVRTLYTVAVTGAQTNTQTAGTFDLDVDSNGRWSVERFKGLMFQIEREANRVAQTTRRGRGNFILCSADVASALAMAGKLDIGGLGSKEALDVDDTGNTFVGVLNGKYKTYIDPYMANGDANQFALVGYKGPSAFDAGMFYCPYVPLTMYKAIDPVSFQPKIAFKTRYGIAGNPLNGANAPTYASTFNLVAQTNYYYRLMRVINIA
jgi:hypothetical protein